MYVIKVNIYCDSAFRATNLALIMLSSRRPSLFDVETMTRFFSRMYLRMRCYKHATAIVANIKNLDVELDKPFELLGYFYHFVPATYDHTVLSVASRIVFKISNQRLYQRISAPAPLRGAKLAVFGSDENIDFVKKNINVLNVRAVNEHLHVLDVDADPDKILCTAVHLIGDTNRFAVIDHILRKNMLSILADAEPIAVYSFKI